jgi:hypothetical protein
MRRRLIIGAFAVLALAVLLPATAAAAGVAGIFQLRASHGYRILVLAGADRSGHGETTLFVGRGHSLARYTVAATVTESTIEADLGALGRIDVVLVGSGEKVQRRICGGRRVEVEPATYEGTIEFHGEGGYTDASATSAPFDYGSLLRTVCGSVGFGMSAGPGVPGAALFASRQRGSEHVHLDVRKNGRSKRTRIEARVSEEREGIQIERATMFFAGSAAFSYDPQLRRATLRPPAPFSGHAIFRRGAGAGHRWSGNLSVDLPGREGVPVAGGGFGARLLHAEWSESRG